MLICLINYINSTRYKMEQKILIKVNSNDTSSAIKEFVRRFEDATIEEQNEDDERYLSDYGITKSEFDGQLNIGIAQSILGITKPWREVKQQLLSKINKREDS